MNKKVKNFLIDIVATLVHLLSTICIVSAYYNDSILPRWFLFPLGILLLILALKIFKFSNKEEKTVDYRDMTF